MKQHNFIFAFIGALLAANTVSITASAVDEGGEEGEEAFSMESADASSSEQATETEKEKSIFEDDYEKQLMKIKELLGESNYARVMKIHSLLESIMDIKLLLQHEKHEELRRVLLQELEIKTTALRENLRLTGSIGERIAEFLVVDVGTEFALVIRNILDAIKKLPNLQDAIKKLDLILQDAIKKLD